MENRQDIAVHYDPWQERERRIPLPSADQQYARVLLVGTTGAGKTTIIRQLLGTDPDKERFPSTSAAKTTTCDMEVVFREGLFAAVVTFLTKDQIQQYIEECISAAVISSLVGDQPREIIRHLLEHAEQRFRLSYLLGTLSCPESDNDGDEDDVDDDEAAEEYAEDSEIDIKERRCLIERLNSYLECIVALANIVREKIEATQGAYDKMLAKDRFAFEELAEQELPQLAQFQELVVRILEDVKSRYKLLDQGELEGIRDGWPTSWTFSSSNRGVFIKAVNRFTSNYAPSFGHLLTPLVQGIRVAGPFCPQWLIGATPKLILMDGQGVGHTANASVSISTSITQKYQIADTILLVDNAKQPMQAAPCSVLKSLAASGYEDKLMIAFTHFDEVTGPNMPSVSERRNHVLGSLDNAIHGVGKKLGDAAEAALRKLDANGRVFFLSRIQKNLTANNKLTRKEFGRLLDMIAQSIIPPAPIEIRPQYDLHKLAPEIQLSTGTFNKLWKGILGLDWRSDIQTEHWARIKALTRRISYFDIDEYDTLRPVADLIEQLQDHISKYLSSPCSWYPPVIGNCDIEKQPQVLADIKKEAYRRLHEFAHRRVIDEQDERWDDAYALRGNGSTRIRANALADLYQAAAPNECETMENGLELFLSEVEKLVGEAITAGGGDVLASKA